MSNSERSIFSKIVSSFFIVCFVLMLFFPVPGRFLDKNIELKGVTATTQITKPTFSLIMNGKFQESVNNWLDENFDGRKILIKLRSQGLYSLFNTSPNDNVLIGRNKYLYEPSYIREELKLDGVGSDEYFTGLIDKLENIQRILNKEGKELYIFITPSKAHFYKEYIPQYYADQKQDVINNYQIFLEYLSKSSLKYFDSHAFIENYSDRDMNYPVFYPTGIHWSYPWGQRCALEFERFIAKNSKWKLSKLTQEIVTRDGPGWPEADLYQSLNLIANPKGIQYFSSKLSIIEEGEHPNVFFRGGSFMGQSLNALVSANVFGKNAHFENNNCFTNKYYKNPIILSSFTAYDEFTKLKKLLRRSDILILECNENMTTKMSWGFIEYILAHPDYLKYPKH